MKVYFLASDGSERVIAESEDDLDQIASERYVIQAIHAFCGERNFHIPYIRIWDTEHNGRQVTMFDVGSHTEFFFSDSPINSADT